VKGLKPLFLLTSVTLLSTFLLWLPFLLSGRFDLVKRNYDGPNYILVAKSFYNPRHPIFEAPYLGISPIYYAAHYPLYPILTRLLGFLLPYFNAMLLVTLLTSVAATLSFYHFIREFNYSPSPFFLSLVFLFLPARWLVIRSVGANEPLFITLVLASFYFFKKKRYFWAGIFGAFGVLTRAPGILLFGTYTLHLILKFLRDKKINPGIRIIRKASSLLLIPMALILLFFFYKLQYNDFFAHFHSGDNIHLKIPPLQALNNGAPWNEDLVWIYLLYGIGVLRLFTKGYLDLGIYTLMFWGSTLFVEHRDISRYILPAFPFGLLIGFEEVLRRREFKIIFPLFILISYIYALNFIPKNVAPMGDSPTLFAR
jgi:hypothetical protein